MTGARRWALAGFLAGALLAVAVWAPATWLASAVNSASDGRLLLAEARGTVWNGSAVVVLTGGQDSRDASALPGRLHWLMRPILHEGAGLALHLDQACCLRDDATVFLKPGLGRTQLEIPASKDWLAQVPTGWLAGLGTPWNTLELGGQLRLRSSGLKLETVAGRWRIAGSAAVELHALSSRLSTLPTLGSYRMDLRADPANTSVPGAALQLSTLEGALRLSAAGRWDGTGLRLRGDASAATPADEAALGNLLNIIGRRRGAQSVISIG
ncbi:MAG: type II secretion system protein N [Ideonella sp.]